MVQDRDALAAELHNDIELRLQESSASSASKTLLDSKLTTPSPKVSENFVTPVLTQNAIMSMFGMGRPQPSSAEKIAAAEQEIDLVTDMFNKYAIASPLYFLA